MSRIVKTDHSAYVVIEKTHTFIWEDDSKLRNKPYAIYDPRSLPPVRSGASSIVSPNFNSRGTGTQSNQSLRFHVGWIRPSLDPHYGEMIYRHIKDFDEIFIVGGGLGRWSGVNDFIRFINRTHPKIAERISYQCYFRLADFSDEKLRKIFRLMLSKL